MIGSGRQRMVLYLKFLLAAAVLVWLLVSGQLDLSQLSAVQDRWFWFIAAQICFGCAQLIAAMRWRVLLASQGLSSTLGNAFRLTLLGIFFNQVLLGTTGGDMARAYAVAMQHPGRGSAAVVSVVADRAVGLYMLLVVALVAGAVNWRLVSAEPVVATALTIIAAVLLLVTVCAAAFFSRELRSRGIAQAIKRRLPFPGVLARLDNAIWAYHARLNDVRRAAVLSMMLHVMNIATNLCLALALVPFTFDPLGFLVLIPVALALMAIPLNPPGALGTGEAIYQHLLSLIGFSSGSLVCILQRLTFVLWSAPGAAVYVLTSPRATQSIKSAVDGFAQQEVGRQS